MQNSISRVVVVGASAGGAEALKGLVAQLSPDFPAPVFIVNHMGPETTGKALVAALNKAGTVRCSHARDGESFERAHVYLAPSDQHLLLVRGKMLVTKGARENRYRPAIDPLFRTAAVAYGTGVIGIILTGYLDDGTSGMKAIKRCGGICIVQDPADAAYPDMPLSVIRHVGADYCVPLAQMGGLLENLAARKVGASKKPPADLVVEAKIAERVVSDLQSVEALGTHSPQTVSVTLTVNAPSQAPTIFNPSVQLLQLNDAATYTAFSPPGSFFQYTLDYTDPDGDINETASWFIEFEYSDGGPSGSLGGAAQVTGDGFSGQASVYLCLYFGASASVTHYFQLYDAEGNESNVVEVTVGRPDGANSADAAVARPARTILVVPPITRDSSAASLPEARRPQRIRPPGG